MPRDVSYVKNQFEKDYLNKFRERELRYVMSKGSAEICIQFNAKTSKILIVSTYQMMILLLFNNKNILTFKDIINGTNISLNELIGVLSLLIKSKVLKKSPNTKKFENLHKFKINSKYCNDDKVKIEPSRLDGIDDGMEIKKIIKARQIEAIFRLRRDQTDAAIVRIMKVKKTLKHIDLCNTVLMELNNKFKPQPVYIKNRIQNLIQLEYIERDENNRRLYHYKM